MYSAYHRKCGKCSTYFELMHGYETTFAMQSIWNLHGLNYYKNMNFSNWREDDRNQNSFRLYVYVIHKLTHVCCIKSRMMQIVNFITVHTRQHF